MTPVSKYRPLRHYVWGNGCDGWNLVDELELSVKQERMPAGTAEVKHYHAKPQQFFFILQGIATFETAHSTITVPAGEGLQIAANTTHRILNNTSNDLEFILCSQPSTTGDRINCEQDEKN